MPGWKPAHCPACFPFPTFQQMLILISHLPEIEAHKHDRSTLQNPGEFGQNIPNGTRRSVGVTRSFSFGFIFPSRVQTARYLEIRTYLNVNQPLAGDETHPRLLCITFFFFFVYPKASRMLKPGLKQPDFPLLFTRANYIDRFIRSGINESNLLSAFKSRRLRRNSD